VWSEVTPHGKSAAPSDEIWPADSISNIGDVSAYAECESLSSKSIASHFSCFESIASLASAANEQRPTCFLSGALIKIDTGQLVEMRQLVQGSHVLSSKGNVLEVQSIRVVPPQLQPLVELKAGHDAASASVLMVTASHRVMIQRGRFEQTIPAGSLQQGDHVHCSGGRLEELVSVRAVTEEVEVIEVRFHPDEPVEAFCPAILSKGHGWPRTTRRSKCRRRNSDEEISITNIQENHDADNVSIPDTEDSWY